MKVYAASSALSERPAVSEFSSTAIDFRRQALFRSALIITYLGHWHFTRNKTPVSIEPPTISFRRHHYKYPREELGGRDGDSSKEEFFHGEDRYAGITPTTVIEE